MTDPADGSAAPGGRAPSRGVVIAAFSLLCLIWGSTWLVIREGLQDMPPATSAGVRFTVAAILMALIAPRLARAEGGARPTLRLTLAMGVLNFAVSYSLVYWSETVLPSGLVSVLWSIFPLMVAVLGHGFLPDERLVGRQWLGLVVGFVGIGLLFMTDVASVGPAAVPVGLALLLSPAASAVGQIVVKREAGGTSSVLMTRNGMFVGAALLVAWALVADGDATVRWTPMALGSIAYLAVFGTVVTFTLYFWLLRHAPAYQLSLIAYITPIIALTLGATVGDEPVGLHTVTGTGLVLGGVALVMLRRRAKPMPMPMQED